MSDTIDRLVRILDEERDGYRRARESTAQLGGQLMQERNQNQRATADLRDALKKIDDWERFGKALQAHVPVPKQKGWPAFPDHFVLEGPP